MRLSDEQRMLRETAREFAQRELAPHAAEGDREARRTTAATATAPCGPMPAEHSIHLHGCPL